MSSKLIRGEAVAAVPVDWKRLPSGEAMAGGSEAPEYISPPGLPDARKQEYDAEQQIKAAHRKGFEEGHNAAAQTLAAQVEAMQMKLARSIEELTGSRLRYRRQAEQDIVSLALAVARRILHRELTVAPEALLGLVKAALDKIEAREIERIRVSRGDAAMLTQFFGQMGLPQRIEVIPDAGLAPGGVLIESARGVLDASVDSQLAEIERGFADLVRSSS